MADSWAPTVKDWANGAIITESDMDTEVRDRMTAIYNALTADASADTDIWHGHKSGALGSRPAAGKAGRLYYATDLGVQFIDNGTRWDAIGVNTRLCEHFAEEFMLSNVGTTFTTLPAGLTWSPAVTGSGSLMNALNPGISELRLISGTTINSTVTLSNQAGGTHYRMDQASDRVPAIWAERVLTNETTNQTLLVGLAAGGGATPDGIYFKRTDTASVGNWRCITRNAGVESNTDSGVAGNTAWRDLEIFINALGNITFYIDGTLEATHTTNIPSTVDLAFQHYFTNAVSSQRTARLDRLDWYARR